MNYFKLPLVVLLSICVSGLLAIVPAGAQGTTALERGYRTGYSDGYTAGYSDVANSAPRNYQNKEDYQKADRSYNDVWGPVEDYRDGYQQGFEAGRRPRDETHRPIRLARRRSGGSDVGQVLSDDLKPPPFDIQARAADLCGVHQRFPWAASAAIWSWRFRTSTSAA